MTAIVSTEEYDLKKLSDKDLSDKYVGIIDYSRIGNIDSKRAREYVNEITKLATELNERNLPIPKAPLVRKDY